ncbi:MAG: class I SAM-dependent methyltransferase [Promethearchaeota archaeon]
MHSKKEVQFFYDSWFNRFKKRSSAHKYIVRWKRARLRTAIASFLDKFDGNVVLDFGCGAGHLTDLLLRRFRLVVGVDISRIGVKTAWKRSRVKEKCDFILADALHLPFKSDCFDVIVMSEVLEHLYDQAQALKNAKRVVKPHGHFIITTPNRLYRDVGQIMYKCALRRYNIGQIVENQLYPGVLRSLVKNYFNIERVRGVYFTVPCAERLVPNFLLPLRIWLSITFEKAGLLTKIALHQCLLCSPKIN